MNATKALNILYSLSRSTVEERAREYLEHLRNSYESGTSEGESKMSTDQTCEHVVAHCRGVSAQLTPWELQESGLYKQRCAFSDPERTGLYFASDEFDRLPPDRLLKSFVFSAIISGTNDA